MRKSSKGMTPPAQASPVAPLFVVIIFAVGEWSVAKNPCRLRQFFTEVREGKPLPYEGNGDSTQATVGVGALDDPP